MPTSFDWIADAAEPPTEYCRYIRNYGFASTPLGNIEQWPPILRLTVCQMMAYPKPRAMGWGPKLYGLHNEAMHTFVKQLGREDILGRPIREMWPEAATPELEKGYEEVFRTGNSVTLENRLFLLHDPTKPVARTDPAAREHYIDITISPIFDERGQVAGIMHDWAERNSSTLGDRRCIVADLIESGLSSTFNLKEAWQTVIEALENNVHNIPFAVAFSVDTDVPADTELWRRLNFEASTEGLTTEQIECLKKEIRIGAWSAGKSVVLKLGTAISVPGNHLDTPVQTVFTIAVPRQAPPEPLGIFVLAINPCRPYDTEYQQSHVRLKQSIGSRLALIQESQIAKRMEDLFKSLGTSTPIGLAFWTRKHYTQYEPTWWNQTYLDLFSITGGTLPAFDTKFEEGKTSIHGPLKDIHPEDRHVVEHNWRAMVEGRTVGAIQFRVHRKAGPKMEPDAYRWLLFYSSQHYHEGTRLHSIGGWAFDITERKQAEQYQVQQINDAVEAKRQSEHFIDMVSHELRNPMGAILQSADTIFSAVRDLDGATPDQRLPQDITSIAQGIGDATAVIELCTQHQKRIVDDVLTLSKLDARLLIIAPEEVQVRLLMRKIVQMYDAELRNAEIDCETHIDESYDQMQLSTVMLDPGRLLQVLINLFTNAIKYTRGASHRKIDIHLGASFTRPEHSHYVASYVPSNKEAVLGTEGTSASSSVREFTQKTIFLEFSIEDSGRGLSEKELKNLFKKFSHASPKTYGKYGGSGLGLFITRDLVELQGGQIGVMAKEGLGATFFFYIKVERVEPRTAAEEEELARGAEAGAKFARKTSLTELLVDFKKRKNSIDYTTTESTPVSSTKSLPEQSKRPSFRGFGARSMSETYKFDSPSEFTKSFMAQCGPIHVLLVEDNLINQRILAQQLRKEGCFVSTADNGLEGVHFVRQSVFAAQPGWSPDATEDVEQPNQSVLVVPKLLSVVLMDIEMPIMNGIEATSKLRELEADGTLTGHVPIIAITAYARPEFVQKALDAGMDEVLTKPFKISRLLEKMADTIEMLKHRGGGTSVGMVPL